MEGEVLYISKQNVWLHVSYYAWQSYFWLLYNVKNNLPIVFFFQHHLTKLRNYKIITATIGEIIFTEWLIVI